jgi:HlyD family secretion protein
MKTMRRILIAALLFVSSGCADRNQAYFQGYAEGEFVYVSSPIAGELKRLEVRRGEQVKVSDPLFLLDDVSERAARDEAARRLKQAQANVDDLSRGKRISEIQSITAQLKQAQATLDLSSKTLVRNRELLKVKAISQQVYDESFSDEARNRQVVNQFLADLETARLGAREDQREAAEQEMLARRADLERMEWELGQKVKASAVDSLVFDTYFREGEFVPAGQAVLALLPPANIKVKTFVPETRLSSIRIGQRAKASADGMEEPIEGDVSFISAQAEYTPPVIYSRESRSKLLYRVELRFDPAAAQRLHPGQPVEVTFLE